MYRQLRGLGALGAGECPQGYSFENGQCVPNWYDCKTPSGQYGEEAPSGDCIYIAQPLPNPPCTYPSPSCPSKGSNTTPGTVISPKTPTATQPKSTTTFGNSCNTVAGPGRIDYFGTCVYLGAGFPCGNGGLYDVHGNCLNENPVAPAPQPAPPPVVPQPTPQERAASCKQYYGQNSASVFHQGQWVCNTCRADEVIDPSDGHCWCGPDKVRSVTGDANSPCVPKLAPQPAPPPVAQASMGKAFFAGAVVLGILGLGAMLVGGGEDRA